MVGYRTQSDLARAIRALEQQARLPGDLKAFSQQWLSTLEDDRSGETIGGARPRQIRALAYMLRWSADEFENAVGIPIGSVPEFDAPRSPTTTPALVPSASADDAPVEIPNALLEAAREFGSRPEFAGLREPAWQNFLARLHHRRTPVTAADWLAVFLDLRERLEPPR
ncbi:hypothetical protein GO986_18825 [Deinococcus sp. HMF7620]|uniref:Uncharacterized protein n=1 Tax=Deinococcus arboris TaxID=2682977 RepID=A0A7C9LPF2_9DEIO|nr:hypothetical protein [Deinococcus arboris]MVN88797.1 hypothetical protein [Deinococcus arboris]